MRNLVIARIREMMLEDPDIQLIFDIDYDDLDAMSNKQLLDLLEEILTEELE